MSLAVPLILVGCALPPTQPDEKKIAFESAIDEGPIVMEFPTMLINDSFEFSVSAINKNGANGRHAVVTPKAIFFLQWREDARVYIPVTKVFKKDVARVGKGSYLWGPKYVSIQTRDNQFYAFLCRDECEKLATELEEGARQSALRREAF